MAILIIGIGTVVPPKHLLQRSKIGDVEMITRLNAALDRTALTLFVTVAAVTVFAFPFMTVATLGAIH